MLYTYGTSMQGLSHKESDTPCQDAHRIEILDNGWVIAAVADGVGSAENSQYGSELAVDTVVDFAIDNIPFNGTSAISKDDLIALLKISFYKAFKNILELAKREGNPFSSYDTTLDVIIYNGNIVIYGHCSDGGIIVLGDDGKYYAITERLKGDDGESMIPLRFNEKWVFGYYEFPVTAVMMFTDGIYDFVNQKYLEYNWTTSLYINLLKCFADKNGILDEEQSFEQHDKAFDDFMQNKFWDSVKDDKTVVTIINMDKDTPITDEENYYDEPDWEQMEKQIHKKLYGTE